MKKLARILFPAISLLIVGNLFVGLQAQPFRLSEGARSIRVAFPDTLVPYLVFMGSISEPSLQSPPMMGNYQQEGDSLVFTPLFPFRPGKHYTVMHQHQAWFRFSIPPDRDQPPAVLSAIYPSADTLPANLLKIYLHFSTPMQEDVAYQYLSLTDKSGQPLPQPFLLLQPPLWDTSAQRLTLWFDPGRVKRALGPNELSGAPLQAGNTYTLTVKQEWPDQSGQALLASVSKSFFVSSADREKPTVQNWNLSLPRPGTREALKIDFGEALDHALLENTISIWSLRHKLIPGEIQLTQAEHQWSFIPSQNWEKGSYRIHIASRLEDLAGNNLNRLFDRDLLAESDEWEEQDFFWLAFEVGGVKSEE